MEMLPLTLTTGDLEEDEVGVIFLLLPLLPREGIKATVDAAPKHRAKTAPGKNRILLLLP